MTAADLDDVDADVARMITQRNNRQRLGYYIGDDGPATGARGWRPPRQSAPATVVDYQPPTNAACRGLGADLFYTEDKCAEAIRACHACPALWPCRYAHLEVPSVDQYGVAGGLYATDRVALRQRWGKLDTSVMRARRAQALDYSWILRSQRSAA